MNLEIATTAAGLSSQIERRLIMPQGIIGFNDLNHYTLTALSLDAEDSLFWELQSIENKNASFILMMLRDLAINTCKIQQADLNASLRPYNINASDCEIYLVISIEANSDGTKTITANVRAPFILHTPTHRAWQIVLSDRKYPISQII